MRIGIVIASYRRPHLIQQFLETIQSQSRQPDEVVLSVVDDNDLPDLTCTLPMKVLQGPAGSCIQRNRGIDYLQGRTDAIVFLDDDFWMSKNYIAAVESIFTDSPAIAGLTGKVIADGATTAPISIPAADAMLADYQARQSGAGISTRRDVPDTYGCNMAFRTSSIGAVRFDERLPLYGWQEDVDFSSQVKRQGRLVWTDELWGIHLGTKTGKTSGVRFGYSQVINPLYVYRKGNMSLKRAVVLMTKNMLANAAKSLFPEPNIDRRGRLRGNLIGLSHLVRGRLKPEHVLKL